MSQEPHPEAGSSETFANKPEDSFVGSLEEVQLPATPAVISEYDPEDDLPMPNRRRMRMFCFECNRPEAHVIAAESRFYYSYLIGFTFGLVFLLGPFQCQCCGARRLFRYNFMNPRYWLREFRPSGGRRSRRRHVRYD